MHLDITSQLVRTLCLYAIAEFQAGFTYRAGCLCAQECVDAVLQPTGTTVSGTVNPTMQSEPTDIDKAERWLVAVLAAHAAMKLQFNGRELDAGALRKGQTFPDL